MRILIYAGTTIKASYPIINIILLFFIGVICHAQNYNVSGKVISSKTNEPLAFATIIINYNETTGTLSDIDGYFSYFSNRPINAITVSYTGYKTQNIRSPQENVLIKLQPAINELGEVMLYSENRANEIIKKTIANKEENNPKSLSSFRYKSYNKVVFDIKGDSIIVEKGGLLEDAHYFITESITKRKYKNPGLSEKVVLATKASGFEDPFFALLATDFQPFSFYKVNFKLFDKYYLNPISKGSLNKYEFTLENILQTKSDTIFIISFQPLPGKNFSGLKGFLHINSDNYAIQNVIASPFEKGTIGIKIQQQYKRVDGKYWFPKQLNFELYFTGYPSKNQSLYAEGKSYIYNVEINIPLSEETFSFKSVDIAADATKKDSLFWAINRKKRLDSIELNTYKVLDSLGQKYNFDKYLQFAKKLANNRIPLGPFDIDLSKTFTYNKFEGFRLGTGIYTNEKISKKLVFGGFFGYGLQDNLWKYGGSIEYNLLKDNPRPSLLISHENTLNETGYYGSNRSIESLLNFRRFLAFRFDKIQKYEFKIKLRSFRKLTWGLSFKKINIEPQYDYFFLKGNQAISDYQITNISINARFAFREQVKNMFGQLISEDTEYPIIYFFYEKGFQKLLESDFSYNKFEFRLEQSFYTKSFGKTSYRLEAGYVDQPLPYGMLFTGEGSFDEDYPFVMPHTFQTMRPYEFLSDKYLNLFFSHNFGGLIFEQNDFQPDIIIHTNISWGGLSKKNRHYLVGFKTKDDVFFETGIELQSLYELNYLNLINFGFGAGAFYRYGSYSYPAFKNNISLKITFNFTIE